MGKSLIRFEMRLPAEVREEGKWFYSSCPSLDVHSQGLDEKEALANLIEALQLFVESCYDRGTLYEVLKQSGFELANAILAEYQARLSADEAREDLAMVNALYERPRTECFPDGSYKPLCPDCGRRFSVPELVWMISGHGAQVYIPILAEDGSKQVTAFGDFDPCTMTLWSERHLPPEQRTFPRPGPERERIEWGLEERSGSR